MVVMAVNAMVMTVATTSNGDGNGDDSGDDMMTVVTIPVMCSGE